MPTIKCGGCAKYLSATEAVKCDKCHTQYHRTCASITLKGLTSPWKCPECSKTTRKGNKAEIGSQDALKVNKDGEESIASSINVNLASEFQSFKEELREEFAALRREFQLVRSDVSQLRDSLKVCNNRIDGMDARLRALEDNKVMRSGTEENDIAQLKIDLNDRDQELLGNDLEIANVSEPSSENIIHTVKLIATKLGMSIDDKDIVSADRTGARHIDATDAGGAIVVRPRRIIVRFARRDVRDEVLRNARVRRGATTADCDLPGPPKRFYVNERLTKLNRQLFRQAREDGKRQGWKFIWTRRGRILARRNEGDSVCVIRHEKDLTRVFETEKEKQ